MGRTHGFFSLHKVGVYDKVRLPSRISSSIRPRFPLTNDQADGKPCITDYRILAISSFCSKKIALVSLRPITGRTHQLRIHCAKELNAPILGDYLYQGNLNLSRAITGLCCTSAAGKVGLPSGRNSLFLHCRSILLPPLLQGGSALRVDAPFPDYFLKVFPRLSQ